MKVNQNENENNKKLSPLLTILTIKVTTNITSVLCAEERWKEEDGAGLSIFEQLDG